VSDSRGMKNIVLFLLAGTLYCNSQSIDHNTKKGYAAEGYDVVAYFDNQALKGHQEYETTYDGVKYKFANEDHLNRFLENPEKFIPQYGGYCAYAIGQSGKKVGVNPETFEIRDGKLYLFYNAWGTNTLELWLKEDAKVLRQKADKNWEALKHQ